MTSSRGPIVTFLAGVALGLVLHLKLLLSRRDEISSWVDRAAFSNHPKMTVMLNLVVFGSGATFSCQKVLLISTRNELT